jgi:hypothetical protein
LQRRYKTHGDADQAASSSSVVTAFVKAFTTPRTRRKAHTEEDRGRRLHDAFCNGVYDAGDEEEDTPRGGPRGRDDSARRVFFCHGHIYAYDRNRRRRARHHQCTIVVVSFGSQRARRVPIYDGNATMA